MISQAKTKYNPLTINALIGSIPQGIVIDDQLSLSDLIGLAEDFHSINPNSIQTQTLPTISDGYVSPWGDVLFVDQPAAQQMLVSLFGTSAHDPDRTPTGYVAGRDPAAGGRADYHHGTSEHRCHRRLLRAATTAPSFDPVPCTPG